MVLAGAAAECGGDRRRPVTGVPCAAARRAVGLASEGRGESLLRCRARPGLGGQELHRRRDRPPGEERRLAAVRDGVPRRIKAAWLDDDTIKYLAAYAARLRGNTVA